MGATLRADAQTIQGPASCVMWRTLDPLAVRANPSPARLAQVDINCLEEQQQDFELRAARSWGIVGAYGSYVERPVPTALVSQEIVIISLDSDSLVNFAKFVIWANVWLISLTFRQLQQN